MTKRELSQLYYLNREIERDKERLKELEYYERGITMKLTGMPHGTEISDKTGNYAAEIADLKSIIDLNMDKCWYELRKLNRFIESIDDSLTRQIVTLRFINGLGWVQIAMSIGGGNTADSVRMIVNRYLEKN